LITRPRTILAALLLAGVALGPRCATTSRTHPDASEPRALETNALPEPAVPAPVAEVASAADSFRSSVRPILSTRCAPCHEPGGKMYARLPFDDPQVVAANSTAMLRRLKGDDRAALERWVEELAAATPAR
jgi:hypothetical protein